MIRDGTFPYENLAFQLFMDVSRFHSCTNTSEMKYSETVKKFWRIGYKLFHGKFLRFMSGPKHYGALVCGGSTRGNYFPDDVKINFAVPIRTIKSDSLAPLAAKQIEPGILNFLLDKVAENSTSVKTYKLCLDGKKINSSSTGKCGDIDLWGYEHSPSLIEKREKLSREQSIIKELSDYTSNLVHKNYDIKLKQLPSEAKEIIKTSLFQIIKILSERLMSLRQMKISKENSRDKLKMQVGQEWEKSKLAFVISSLITCVYDLNACINTTLKVIDEACHVISSLNGVSYATANVVDLSRSKRYMHLVGDHSEPRYVKQRSTKWHELRKQAMVTGSTLYDALGLRSLKCQTAHFDEVVSNIPKPEPTEHVKRMMTHGSNNEIHACATIAEKVLPVLNPELKLFEEGCYQLSVDGVPAVVSPDGSCRLNSSSHTKYAVEIKCPFPGNKFRTPVHYQLPKQYVPQLLSEMKALDVEVLYYVSYSTESTTVQEVTYDDHLWNVFEKAVKDMFGSKKPTRPTRRSVHVPHMHDMITTFISDNVKFICEIPSVTAQRCHYEIENDEDSDDPFCSRHTGNPLEINDQRELKHIPEIAYNAGISVRKSYQLTRNKASELLAFMISDLDRNFDTEMLHSVPIAYGLKGYSLPSDTLRKMISDVLTECANRGLYVPVCSFDGQWYRLVVRDKQNQPLTVLQLQKDVFQEVKHLSKSEIVRRISQCNIIEAITYDDVQTVADVSMRIRINQETSAKERFIEVKRHKHSVVFSMSKHTSEVLQRNQTLQYEEEQREESVEENFLNNIDDDILNEVTSEIAEDINLLSSGTEVNTDRGHEPDTQLLHTEQNCDTEIDSTDMEEHIPYSPKCIVDINDVILMLDSLKDSDNGRKIRKWDIPISEFQKKFATAETMNKSFLASELNICVRQVIGKLRANGIKLNLSANKSTMINTLSVLLGDGSLMISKTRRKHKVPSLKTLTKDKLKKLKKEFLNIIYAENIFPRKLNDWYKNNPFGKYINISSVDCSEQSTWYSRPEFCEELGHYIFMILDAYHQLCGARRLFCLKGIRASGIENKYVHKVAEESESNGCGLRSAMVTEPMLDRQSVAYTVKTFSEEVQKALSDIGGHNEAKFCQLIREWYRAEDEPSIPALQRCIYRLRLRKWLLSKLSIGIFPPCGSYIKDIPIVLFEGLLTGIERRIQLYPFTKSGAYNVRAIGSLDIENFFGGLQDIDPRGTGVLRPDDISTALSVAAEITGARINPNRGFYMMTSSAKVYPCKAYQETSASNEEEMQTSDEEIKDLSAINVKDHQFDVEERSRGKRKRKLGNISGPEEPVRRPTTVREHHKTYEAKILPHVRRGLNLQNQ